MSEDFDLAMRLLLNGYTLRWATYSLGGFKEGVSLTVVDELARWQKYAYGMLLVFFFLFFLFRMTDCAGIGCNEIIFNPLVKWSTRPDQPAASRVRMVHCACTLQDRNDVL